MAMTMQDVFDAAHHDLATSPERLAELEALQRKALAVDDLIAALQADVRECPDCGGSGNREVYDKTVRWHYEPCAVCAPARAALAKAGVE